MTSKGTYRVGAMVHPFHQQKCGGEVAASNQPSAPGRDCGFLGGAKARTKAGPIPGHVSTKGFELSMSN